MLYALISDIHANLQALDAVLADMDRRGITAIYHLGDLAGYSSSPNEVVDRLRERGIPGISGNYDSTVANDYKHCGCRSESPRQEELSHISYEWTRAHVLAATKDFLGNLPFRIDLRPLGGHVAGVHFINTGSVGRPKDGDWRAGYVLLEVSEAAVNAEIIRVEYDVDLAARSVIESGLPEEFAEFLRSGGRTMEVTSS
ncbi:MAG: metallophosphoesterase family protein [Gemmatimonadaceae bacterium]|nr:metallophosphoesterase family protein [Gemmatimonadaceae bacterium]